MPNEIDLNKLIERYTILEKLHDTSEQRLPLRVPEQLTADEYYRLAEKYIRYRWVHHAKETLRRAATLNPEWKNHIEHMQKTALPPVIPSVEAVEANLQARNEFHATRSRNYNDLRSLDSAYALAKYCVQRFPDFDDSHLTLGELEDIRKEHRAAIAAYEKALERNPFCVEAMVQLGGIWLRRVKILKAKAWFEKALECDPENSAAEIGLDSVRNVLNKPMWLLSCKYAWVSAIVEWQQQRDFKKLMRDARLDKEENPNLLHRKERSGFMDRSGNLVFHYDGVRAESKFSDAFFYCVQKRQSASFVDKSGNDAFGGREFRWAEDFSENLASVLVGEKWGFIERHGHFAIEPQFEDVGSFSDGLAAARHHGLWGFIDNKGEWVVEPRFENVLAFTEERAAVSLNDKIAIVDSRGQPITDFEFDEVGRFAEGLARTVKYETEVERHSVKFLDRDGEISFDLNSVYLDLFGENTIGYGREANNWYRNTDEYLFAGPGKSRHTLTSTVRRNTFEKPANKFSDGRLLVNQGTRCGYLDRSGALVIPVEFYIGAAFANGLALVSLNKVEVDRFRTDNKNVPLAFIDDSGQVVIRLEPGHHARSFSSGLAYVYDDCEHRWFIDKAGSKVFELGKGIGRVGNFHGDLAAVERSRRSSF